MSALVACMKPTEKEIEEHCINRTDELLSEAFSCYLRQVEKKKRLLVESKENK